MAGHRESTGLYVTLCDRLAAICQTISAWREGGLPNFPAEGMQITPSAQVPGHLIFYPQATRNGGSVCVPKVEGRSRSVSSLCQEEHPA